MVKAYDYRCAFCGVRILTSDGHAAVEAAHIIPWSQLYNDSPRNGLSLCHLCHWSFDEGLMSVSNDYLVLLSRQIRDDRNMPGHLATLEKRNVILPVEQQLWPERECLAFHREKIFRNR